MANSWGSSWGSAWGSTWGGSVVVPPVIPPASVYYQGGGGTGLGGGKRKKRRNERQELFAAIEASIREQLWPPEIEADEPAPVVTVPREDWTKLREYAADNAVLSARLTALKRDLDLYEAEQQALRDDDEDFWMMV